MADGFNPRDFVRTLTRRPGIYRMLGADGELLYVGKARDLRRRVGSYFSRRAHDAKTQTLVKLVARVEVTVTATEQEALLLEYNLIKEHKPRFNVVLRDDKSYPYIYVTTHQPFPRFEFHRGRRNLPGRFLGPFPNAGSVRDILQELQKLFRVRQCNDSFFSNRSRPCLQYQIHRCSAPCVGLVTQEEYRNDAENAMRFIEGRDEDVLADLVIRMESSSAALAFERAAQYRDLIADIRRIQERQVIASGRDTDLDAVAMAEAGAQTCVSVLMIRGGRVLGCRSFFPRTAPGTESSEILGAFLLQHYISQPAPPEILVTGSVPDSELLAGTLTTTARRSVTIRQRVRGNRRRWLEMALENARQSASSRAGATATIAMQFAALGEVLQMTAAPESIECFDVSHTQGAETVASCVVFRASGIEKSDYRRFNITNVMPGDDYGALAQAIGRRYVRAARGEAAVPDLIIIDGGRGQLRRARETLTRLGLDKVPVLAVAKGESRRPGYERLYVGEGSRTVSPPADSPALQLIQRIRDEAHRFAITGHRQRRSKARRSSILEAIPGLGPRKRRALLQQFGGLQGIQRAGVGDLARTNGISRALAERIYDRLHEQAPAD